MLNQIKYSARQNLGLRVWAFGSVLVLNVVFIALGALGMSGLAGMIMSVMGASLTSLALTGLLVVIVIADVQAFRSLFAAPGAYTTLLVPAPGWKILLGKIIPMAVFDLAALGIGAAGVVVQGLSVANMSLEWGEEIGSLEFGFGEWMASLLSGAGNYLLLIISIFFVCALVKSVFFRARVKGLLGVASFFAVYYVLNLLDMPLIAMAPYSRFGPFFSVDIAIGFNVGMVSYLLLMLIKIVVLFLATAHLLDRRINL
ncbi:MAG: hypothetical protein FWG14_03495 [Peptococcaceae bacterium]|nr:hypothetical protein [Peptococcaceae bacterium]